MMRLFSTRWYAIGFLSICLGSGCGGNNSPRLGTVTGTITMNHEPVPGVKVVFIPQEKGSPSYGATDENGVFHLYYNQNRAGAELGTHNVQIESREPTTDDGGRIIDYVPPVKVPRKYRQPGALVAEVASGRNEVDFDLEPQD